MTRFPVGSTITVQELTESPYSVLARLRNTEPVSWVPAVGAWFITTRELAIDAMRDDEAFTVDDPRFTTAAVLGPSMLSLDGPEHERHRAPFAPSFRPGIVREKFDTFLREEAQRLGDALPEDGRAELRTGLAGPLAVETMIRFLGLHNVAAGEMLDWYNSISAAIVDLTLGSKIGAEQQENVAQIRKRVEVALVQAGDTLLHEIEKTGLLRSEEMSSAALVLMFGGIETAEGMTANAIWHLLNHPRALAEVRADRGLVASAIEESLRLEPAAAVIDRYATRDVSIGGVTIPAGDLVTISLLAANRDPSVFENPDQFDLHRPNARQHVTFVQGPHGCLGLHLSRMETNAAINVLLDNFPDLQLDPRGSTAPEGLIFRKPDAVWATL